MGVLFSCCLLFCLKKGELIFWKDSSAGELYLVSTLRLLALENFFSKQCYLPMEYLNRSRCHFLPISYFIYLFILVATPQDNTASADSFPHC